MENSKNDPDINTQTAGMTETKLRSDARRNLDSLLQAASELFSESGVDVPVRSIAEKAGVGVGTVYRHFPQRADLVAAVFRREVDMCAEAAPALASEYSPGEALGKWMQRYAAFLGTKRGLAAALHSGSPIFDSLPKYFYKKLQPALQDLLKSAIDTGEIRTEYESEELLDAVASLCHHAYEKGPAHAQRMVELLVDGLRYHEKI